MHHEVMGAPKGKAKQWSQKADANRFSLINKIYDRMKFVMRNKGLTEFKDENWLKAGEILDDTEVGGRTLNAYVKELREKSNYKKRQTKNNK